MEHTQINAEWVAMQVIRKIKVPLDNIPFFILCQLNIIANNEVKIMLVTQWLLHITIMISIQVIFKVSQNGNHSPS